MKTTIASLVAVLWLSLVALAHAEPSPLSPPPRPTTLSDARLLVSPDKNDGPRGVYAFAADVQSAWSHRSYAALDDLLDRWAKADERFDDGRAHVMAFDVGLDLISQRNKTTKDWEQSLGQIREWRQQNPASTAVDIAEANLLKNWAWSARGSGYARSVTEEGWKLFRARLDRAEAVLLHSKDRSSGNPLWYTEYLEIAVANSWDSAEFRALYDAAITRFPDFLPLYNRMIRSLQPRWGGSFEQIDAYVAEVVKQTEARQGKVMYARLYWYLANAEGDDFALFEDSAANWADMKTGFKQIIAATPKSNWNLNNFASFACRAGDADTYRKLRKQIGEKIYEEAWPSNYSMEVCDERLLKKI
jgi:hypothetical protein